jgi:hypothetical protein
MTMIIPPRRVLEPSFLPINKEVKQKKKQKQRHLELEREEYQERERE